jgi:Outer membrane protein beta-barrel domain
MKRLLTIAAVVLALGVASNAAAQRGGGAVEREGFLFGFAVGGGSISCKDCDGSSSGPTLDLHIGTMVGEKMAVMLDGSGIAVSEDDSYGEKITETFTVDTIALQYWVTDRVWVKGGIGAAMLRWSGPNIETVSDTGLGLMAAAGVEVVQKGKFTLDIQGRFLTAQHDPFDTGTKIRFNQIMGMVGFNWY